MLASCSAHASHRRFWIGSFLELLAQLKCNVFDLLLSALTGKPALEPAAMDCELLYMENEHFSLVDALPYIDTQLGAAEVAQQVKALIEEEMTQFETRDYLASLPAPELPFLNSSNMQEEFSRVSVRQPLGAIDQKKYEIERPEGEAAEDEESWKKIASHGSDELRIHTHQVIELRTPGAMGQKGLDSSQYADPWCWESSWQRSHWDQSKPRRGEQETKNLTRSLVATTCESWCENLNSTNRTTAKSSKLSEAWNQTSNAWETSPLSVALTLPMWTRWRCRNRRWTQNESRWHMCKDTKRTQRGHKVREKYRSARTAEDSEAVALTICSLSRGAKKASDFRAFWAIWLAWWIESTFHVLIISLHTKALLEAILQVEWLLLHWSQRKKSRLFSSRKLSGTMFEPCSNHVRNIS